MEIANQCSYCKKTFKQEKTMFVHMCEQKRRVLAKNEKANVVGYSTFVSFFKVSQPTMPNAIFELTKCFRRPCNSSKSASLTTGPR